MVGVQRFTRRLVGVGLLVGTGLLAAALLAWMVSGLLDLSFRAALEWTTFVVAAAAPLLVGTTNYSIADDQARACSEAAGGDPCATTNPWATSRHSGWRCS